METVRCICVVLLLCLMRGGLCHQYKCGGPAGILDVKFPDKNKILSLDAFQEYVVGRTLHEMYFALSRPPTIVPDLSYKATITPLPETGTFLLKNKGVTMAANPECVLTEYIMRPAYLTDRAMFFYPNNTTLQVYMSECPASYIVSMRCTQYDHTRRRCPIKQRFIGIYTLDNLDDVPISDITTELCRTIGVKFGAQDMKWFFTFGDNDLC